MLINVYKFETNKKPDNEIFHKPKDNPSEYIFFHQSKSHND